MLFSVIIPVYNVENYLKECINSVLKQDFCDYEIILVDDGSTDSSPVICDEFKEKYNIITVIHKQNGGLSDARNAGMSNASGRYIIFLDSDDYWDDVSFLNKMSVIIEAKKSDIIIFGYKKIRGSKLFDFYTPHSTAEKIDDVLVDGDFNICAWDKAIRSELLFSNQIYFRKNVYSEDMEWCALLFKNAETVTVLKDTPYSYRQREGSITKKLTEKNISDVKENYEKCKRIAEDMPSNKCKAFNYYLAKNISMFMIALSQFNFLTRKKYYNFLKENCIYLKNTSRTREKLIYFSCKFFGITITESLLSSVYRLKNKNV